MAREQAQVAFQTGTKKWRYKGVSADGRTKQKGVIEAQTRDQAIDRVNKLGLIPTELVDVNAGTGLNTNIEIKAFEKYPSKKDFAVMSRQLATMVAAGVSLIRALNIVTEQIGNVKLRNAVRDCMQQVEAGSSFSEAMDNNPDHLFPPIMTNMVRAGETGGFLDKSLITVADSFEADVRLQGQIKGALAYPVVVLGIAVLLVGVMLLTIVPMFDSMYASMGAELPWVTQIMVDMGKAAPVGIPVIIVCAVAFVMFWKCNRNKDIIRTWWDPFTLKAPVFGKLTTNVALARFCNNFASMLASGVPILQALDIVGSTSGNYVIDEASKRVSRLVERGYRLADSMGTEKCSRT
ncbi:type II secretion system F family protein [Bifidobacterium pseudocatenulatum]|uniref:type II secretion system F family protein n=1 Tax=Bifidobacterium pseudocatenulatum TaxID=28026 RepID=UPI002285F57B|nr:type II secretion system F family protein [Bifidobacterium pseudocatenulatum]